MRLFLFCITVLATALCMAGCGASPDRPEVDWRHGAKRGRVAEIYTSSTPRAQLPACLAALGAEQLDQRHFARIEYRHVRHMLTEVAELPDGVELKLGERVELWPADCDTGQLSRISKVMPPDTE